MLNNFDHVSINHATVALCREMTPDGRARHPDADTVFFGGPNLSDAERSELADFGMKKNYQMIFASFDPSNPDAGPVAFHAVVTDGVRQSYALANGRLWKRERRSSAELIFAEIDAIVKLSAKGRLVVREMKGPYHDHGYDLARDAVLARAARKPGRVPVVAPIGSIITVTDITTVQGMLAAA